MKAVDLIQIIFTALAFLLSVYATCKTDKFNKRQNDMAEVQVELNKLLLRKETNEAIGSFKAELGVNFIKLAKNHKLKVFNKGKGPAKNVRINFPAGNEIIPESDVESKFPLEVMEQHQSVELIAAIHFNSPNKMIIELVWDDDTGLNQSKLFDPTV
jgi:hypothetical protein